MKFMTVTNHVSPMVGARLLAIMLATVVGLLLSSAAFAALPDTKQVESVAAPAFATKVNDSTKGARPNGTTNAMRYNADGTINYQVTVGANEQVNTIAVRARNGGGSDAGKPLSLVAPGASPASITLGTGSAGTTYDDRTFSVNMGPGTYTIGIKITNLTTAGDDENAFVDSFRLEGTTVTQPPADSDGDGVPDSSDKCSGSDDRLDADGDGIPDGCDTQEPPPTNECGSAPNCVDVFPGDDLDAKANAAPAGATIQVHGKAGVATYFYTVNNAIELKSGQTLIGDTGTTSTLGSAVIPSESVGMRAASTSMLTMIGVKGDPVRIAWLDINVAGAQKAINGSSGGPGLQMDHVKVHGAKASGIGQYRGFVFDSEIYGNGTDPINFDGTVAGVKCIYACEISTSYIHNNPGNGAWCDVGCKSVANQPNGFYVHDNVVGSNGRHGIFYENAPKPGLNPGDAVRALITHNTVYGNGKSGVSVSDSAFGTVDSNEFAKTPSGTVLHNEDNVAIELHRSGVSSRGT